MRTYCTGKRVLTYNSIGYDGELTYGGYSEKIVTDERYAIRIPKGIPLENAAPMFCAGVTVYSPLRHWKAGPGQARRHPRLRRAGASWSTDCQCDGRARDGARPIARQAG